MQALKNRFWVVALAGTALVSSCKKTDVSGENLAPTPTPPPTGVPTASAADALKDSALLYSKDIYLWYNQIAPAFDARSYSGVDAVMKAIRQYSTEPGFSGPVDRWSFAIKKTEWNNMSSGVSTGDLGMTVFFRQEGDLRVKLVEKQSPAGMAGVRRGWKITAINGNSNITTANADFIVQNIYQGSGASVTFQKPDNSTVTLNLAAGNYQDDPIILDSVYQVGAHKIGYFAFNSFLGDTTRIYNNFSRIFNRFASANVGDVIIDLRYNGGGYVSMAQKLSNWLAPAAANGQLMMRQSFNDKYSRYNEDETFRKLGSLNLSRIFFIVSNSTASASELVINNLKPFMDVQLVGPSKTYGKPVGYFPIPVGDWFIFPVSFKSVNKNGEGSYFNGLAVNSQVADGLDKDWGDLNENSLRSAVNFITGAGYGRRVDGTGTVFQEEPRVINSNRTLDQTFKGAIDTRRMR